MARRRPRGQSGRVLRIATRRGRDSSDSGRGPCRTRPSLRRRARWRGQAGRSAPGSEPGMRERCWRTGIPPVREAGLGHSPVQTVNRHEKKGVVGVGLT